MKPIAKANQPALDVGMLTERMALGYFTHAAALLIATQSGAGFLAPQQVPGSMSPGGIVKRKDGTTHAYEILHFLRQAKDNPDTKEDLERVWLAGSLLKVGDALAQHRYFDRAPELELVRHLRNGIAHGNRFRIDEPEKLKRFPAHNRLAWVRGDKKSVFEISATLHGKEVLFGFMGPGDVLDLLLSVGLYLIRMGNGDPLRATP